MRKLTKKQQELVTSLGWLVNKLAFRCTHRSGGHLFDEAVSDGWLGAIQAVKKWDNTRHIKVNLPTFAYQRIHGAMVDGLRQRTLWNRRKKKSMCRTVAIDDVEDFVPPSPDLSPAQMVEEKEWVISELTRIKQLDVRTVLLDMMSGEKRETAIGKVKMSAGTYDYYRQCMRKGILRRRRIGA